MTSILRWSSKIDIFTKAFCFSPNWLQFWHCSIQFLYFSSLETTTLAPYLCIPLNTSRFIRYNNKQHIRFSVFPSSQIKHSLYYMEVFQRYTWEDQRTSNQMDNVLPRGSVKNYMRIIRIILSVVHLSVVQTPRVIWEFWNWQPSLPSLFWGFNLPWNVESGCFT